MDYRIFCVLAPLLVCGSVPAAAALLRPDAPDAVNPFLRAPAQSLTALVREVRGDAAVRRRYADFFHVTEAGVAPYLSKNLEPATLRHAGSYTVYFVSLTGVFYPTQMALSPGTPIFVRHDGTPALLRGAGNPLIPFQMSTPAVMAPSLAPAEGIQEQVVPAGGADIPLTVSH